MAYASQQDLIDRFGETELQQLTDKVNRPATTIDETTVSKCLADAEDLVDSYVGKLYSLPIASPPPILTRITCEIARFYLHGRRVDKDDPVSRAHDAAIAWLKDLSKGMVQLEADGIAASQAGDSEVRTEAPDRVFTRDSMKGF